MAAALAWFLISVYGCKTQPKPGVQDAPHNVVREPHRQEEVLAPVIFDMVPVATSQSSSGWHSYDCVYKAGGKTAEFRLEWKQKGAMTADDAFPVASAEGRFVAVAGSDNEVLLTDLKKALDAKTIPVSQVKVAEVPSAVLMGQHQSRSSSDEFFTNPPGDWILLKLFLPKDGDDGEVFLNLNPVLGKAEFSIKDSDYGDYLLKELAQVL